MQVRPTYELQVPVLEEDATSNTWPPLVALPGVIGWDQLLKEFASISKYDVAAISKAWPAEFSYRLLYEWNKITDASYVVPICGPLPEQSWI
jgi:hypothetical protein